MMRVGGIIMAAKKPRKSAFVPRLLVRTAIVGVIPACAVGCGSSEAPTSSTDAGADSPLPLGVAAVAYQAYDAAAKDGAADAQPDAVFLGVAAVAYPAYEAGAPDAASHDSGDAGATDAKSDAFHGFVLAVTAYEVNGPREG
jgi:hypothetical protein